MSEHAKVVSDRWRDAAADAVGDAYLLTEQYRAVARRTSDAAVLAVIEWLRGDEAAAVVDKAYQDQVPAEDALAHVLELALSPDGEA